MRPASAGLIAGLLSMAAPTVHSAQGSYVYTPTHGASCADRSCEEVSRWRCPGPAGYVAEYVDEGNIAGISLWHPARQRRSPLSVSWRGAGRVFGEKLEWRMMAGLPYAAILRIWRIDAAADGREREIEELVVLKVSPSGACRVASVNARQPQANEIAQRMSDGAATSPCLAEP